MSRSKKKKTDRSFEQASAARVQANATFSWWWPLLLALAGIAVYATSFDGAFLFDNEHHIVNNEGIRTLLPPWHLLARRRPVVEISLAINYAFGALRPWGYHLFNVAVHLLAGLTLYGIVRRTLALERFSRQTRASAALLAFCTALLWLVHPLQTQSVTYVIQRGESLMGLFYLLTLYGVLRGATATTAGGRWYALAVAACTLGMGTKAVMVTAPIMVWVFDVCLLSGGPIQALSRRRWLYVALATTWLVLFPLGIVKGVLDPHRTTPGTVGFSNPSVIWSDYLLTQPAVLLRYIQLSFWPVGQCIDYGKYGWLATKELGSVVLPGLIVVVLLAATVAALLKRRPLGVVGAWFFLVLAPTSSFIPIQDPIYEHRMYLPLASLVVLVVMGLHALVNRESPNGTPTSGRRRGMVILVAALAVALGTTSAFRNCLYADELGMWQDVVAKRPNNARGRYNLGRALQTAGRRDEAYREYERAIELEPTFALPYNNLGVARMQQGRLDEAIAYLQRGVSLKPAFPEALVNLGLALLKKHRLQEAEEVLKQAVKYQPDLGQAHLCLGKVYGELGDFARAVDSLRLAVRYLPDMAEPYVWLGKSLAMLGRFDEAVRAVEVAVKLEPGNATAVGLLQRLRAQTTQNG